MTLAPSSWPEPVGYLAVPEKGETRVFNVRAEAEAFAARRPGGRVEDVYRGIPPVTQAAQDVMTERWRQVALEGWHYRHDDRHDGGELALAGASYAVKSLSAEPERSCVPRLWPFGREWWKATTARRMLVKACALLIAEIERLDRVESRRLGRER